MYVRKTGRGEQRLSKGDLAPRLNFRKGRLGCWRDDYACLMMVWPLVW
jgi:hypothetical protein